MVERFSQNKLRWICMKNPTAEEIKKVTDEFGIPPLLMSDVSARVPRDSVQSLESVIKLTFEFPVVKRTDIDHPYEIRFIVSKHSLITVQYDEMGAMDKFKKQFEVASTIRKKQKNLTGADLFFSLMTTLYENTVSKLDYIESILSGIEAGIFIGNEKRLVIDIADVSKKLIRFRHVLCGHEDVFEEVHRSFESVYGKSYDYELVRLESQYKLIERHINTQLETLMALRDTNTTVLTTKQNEVLKTLTIMAFITFPLTLISSMFGMNTEGTPIIGGQNDFWIILGIMITATLCFFTYFKHKGWM